MAKRPPPGRCVHCLEHFEELTWDHVFPEAWYPETTPDNLEKWKIPSCLPCNALHAKGESELLLRLGLCIDPDDPRSAGIAEKALRALSPTHGRSERDTKAREAKRQEILRQAFEGENIPHQAVYPGFGPLPDHPASERVAIPVSATALRRLTEKVIRGLVYVEDSRFLTPPYRVEFFALTDQGAVPVQELLARFGRIHQRGPGISVTRAVVPEDQTSAVYSIEIWGRLKTYAVVSREDSDAAT